MIIRTSTDAAIAGTSLLSAASYCFSGVYRMSAKRDHTEPLVLDALTVAEPSFKKSPVMAMVKQPYIQFAHDWNEAHKQEIPVGHYKRGHDFTNLCAFVSGSASAGNGLRGKPHPQSKRQKGRINPCFPIIKDKQRTNRFSITLLAGAEGIEKVYGIFASSSILLKCS